MANLKEEYRALTVEELEKLLREAVLTPEAKDLCKAVVNEKLGTKRYDVSDADTFPDEKEIYVPSASGMARADAATRKVIITDIKIPFISMVILMVKSVIASIPALIILLIILATAMSLLGGMLGGFGRF